MKEQESYASKDINQPPEKNFKGWKHELLEWLKVIVAASILAFSLNNLVIANSWIPSGSMETTIMTGDRVIGLRLSYLFEEPQRGDVVIFQFSDDDKNRYVKRIIGMPSDVLDISGGHVYLNGSDTPLVEDYVPLMALYLHYLVNPAFMPSTLKLIVKPFINNHLGHLFAHYSGTKGQNVGIIVSPG